MKTVMRGNKQLRVSDDRLEGYKTLGYVEIDAETGVPINPPADPAALRKVYDELAASHESLMGVHKLACTKIAELETENTELRGKNEEAAVQLRTVIGSPVDVLGQTVEEVAASGRKAAENKK